MNLCHAAALNFISFILGGSAGVEEGRVSTLPLGPHMAVVTDPFPALSEALLGS